MKAGAAHLLTASRVVIGALALSAALDGQFTRAAALITASAVVDGLDGKLARWLHASSPFGGVFDYFCDYLCFLVAPWALTRGLLGPRREPLADLILILPLVTGAIRYARNSLLVTSQAEEVRQLPGLATVFFAFVGVVAVFLDAPARLPPDRFAAVLLTMTGVFSVLMVVPIEYPKLTKFRGASPAVLVLLTAMPILGTSVIAFAALVIGLSYVVLGPLWVSGRAPIKYLEKALTMAAGGAWALFSAANRIGPRRAFTPAWSDLPLLKSHERTKPPLGWPRKTDSLCPGCVREAREAILDGRVDYRVLLTERVGEIRAAILERDGRILMVKDCPRHGRFEDVLSIDPAFFKHLEDVFPGRDIRAHNDERLHDHGSSTIEYGRGSVLTVDLTNRCNMMCDPCFMDANQVGFVHELGWDDIKTLLDNAVSIKPRRQMSVQFSGGEPTLSPHFLDAIRYARQIGYKVIQAATNGIEFAKSPDFARAAGAAGLRYAYLQFDGIGNAANSHRQVGNLFEVKLRAIENLWNAGVSCVPVVTLINGVNNEQVGRLVQFALDNPRRIAMLSFQPVSFTGRDESVTPARRAAQRYTLSHLAHDVKTQIGLGEPARDWFPISFMNTFTDWADLVRGPDAQWGSIACGCHPNCGVGMAVMIDKHTKEAVPVSAFLNADRLAADVRRVTDAGRGRWLSFLGLALAVMRNYDPFRAPRHLTVAALIGKFRRKLGGGPPLATREAEIARRRSDRWNFLFIAGMWFQDLFNYDFRRTEMCIIPYATQQGEISFCAYNTGVGWRSIIEKMHMTATLTKWYEEHGRHQIYAGNRAVDLPATDHTLVLDPEAVRAGRQQDLDEQGIAKTAREEKLRARDDARMAALYRRHVLKERPPEPLLEIAGLGRKKS